MAPKNDARENNHPETGNPGRCSFNQLQLEHRQTLNTLKWCSGRLVDFYRLTKRESVNLKEDVAEVEQPISYSSGGGKSPWEAPG